MKLDEIKSLLEVNVPDAVIGERQDTTPCTLKIDSAHIYEVCRFLHDHEKTYFDSLSCLTGIDNGVESNSMEVVYHLYSIPFNLSLALSVEMERDKPEVQSVAEIWLGANWHEREAFDLLGITFKGHPDLRRILLPNDWEGFPLRKDYQEQETYHEVKVKY